MPLAQDMIHPSKESEKVKKKKKNITQSPCHHFMGVGAPPWYKRKKVYSSAQTSV
uniref:Uncharacterized protein n=1 Tax=Canis lupus familiaris TaxID=9615 RepID=A0A8P0P9Y1_CANLF